MQACRDILISKMQETRQAIENAKLKLAQAQAEADKVQAQIGDLESQHRELKRGLGVLDEEGKRCMAIPTSRP